MCWFKGLHVKNLSYDDCGYSHKFLPGLIKCGDRDFIIGYSYKIIQEVIKGITLLIMIIAQMLIIF